MNLPKNWYKRWDPQPGTLQWWTQYATWKTLKLCNHNHTGQGWIKANQGCSDAWQCEHNYVMGEGATGPPHFRD